MDTISVKLPAALRARLASEARRRNVTQSAIVRESLAQLLLADSAERGELTCADLAGDLVGSVQGPRDLSTNKRYLEEAVVKSHARRSKRTG
jgi:hypothetical protein